MMWGMAIFVLTWIACEEVDNIKFKRKTKSNGRK